jgi:hypothetical protein
MCLSYEAFYMQWAPLVVLGLALWKEERIALKPILTTSAGLIFAQAVAAVWYLRHADVSQRRVRLHWAIASVQNLSALVPSMFRSNEEIYAVFVVFTAAVIGFWVFAYVKSFRVPSMQPERRHMTLVSGACLLMGLTSIVIVSLGDRVVTHTGVETRSTMIFNFWIIVTAAIVTIFTFDRLHGKLRPAFAAALGGFALCLAAGQILRADDWAAAWRLQQNILRQAPVAQLQRMEPNAEVVYVNQLWLNSVPIFSDIWGLRNAMAWAYPYLNRSNFLIYSPYRGTLKWDGHRLGFTAEPIQNSEMPSAVYIWEPSEGTFEKATGPFVVGQDMVVRPTS